jgi:cell division protein FtsW
MDKPLLIVSIALFLFGLFNIVSASSREAINNDTSLYYYFYRQLIMLIIGLVIFVVLILTSTRVYKNLSPFAFVIGLGLLLYLLVYGSYKRGAQNWLEVSGFQFQPSELIKPIMIVFLSCYFASFYKDLQNKKISHMSNIAFILFIGLSAPLIIFRQKDLGTMFIILAIFGVMFLVSPILKKDKLKTIGIMGAFCLLLVLGTLIKNGSLLTDEQSTRLDYLNPCKNYEEGGYQICNAYIAINNGGLTGLGIGKSKQKYSYINDPHTDSIFAIVVEEWGLIIALLIIAGFALVVGRILTIALHAKDKRGKYMCIGIATYIFMHIFINLGGLFGLIPLTGVPLPFISYGGTFTICLIASLAVAQRVKIESSLEKVKEG